MNVKTWGLTLSTCTVCSTTLVKKDFLKALFALLVAETPFFLPDGMSPQNVRYFYWWYIVAWSMADVTNQVPTGLSQQGLPTCPSLHGVCIILALRLQQISSLGNWRRRSS